MGDTAADTPEPSRFGRICVFCGSNPGNRAVYGDAALDLGKELVMRRRWQGCARGSAGCFKISDLWLDCLLARSRSVAGFRGFSPLQVARGVDLVYGGGSVGLMGLIAQTVLDGGCGVLGYLLTCTFWRILLLFSS